MKTSRTPIKKIVKDFKFSDLFVVAMDLESEFLQWLKGSKSKHFFGGLPSFSVYESLVFMARILESHPEGISKPEFVKYFVGTNHSKYLPTIITLSDIYNKEGSLLLEPFTPIFENSDIFRNVGESNDAFVKSSLEEISKIFNDYTSTLVNKPFDEGKGSVKTRLTKKEKKKQLFLYLVDNANEKVASSLSQYNLDYIADSIRSDRMFLLDPNNLKKFKMIYPDRDRSHMILLAQKLAKTILKRLDPEDFEYNYNLLINSAMEHNGMMTQEEYNNFFRSIDFQKAREDFKKINRVEFSPSDWLYPGFIEYISIVLMIIMTQVEF